MHWNWLQHCITFCRGGEQQLTQKGLKMQLYPVNWQEMIRGLHIGTFLNSLRLGDDRMQKLHLAGNVCIKRTSLHWQWHAQVRPVYLCIRVVLITPSSWFKLVPVVFVFLLVYYLRKHLSFLKSEWFRGICNFFRLQWEFQWENSQHSFFGNKIC